MLQDKLTKLTPEQLAKVEAYVTELLNAKQIELIEKHCENCKYENFTMAQFPCDRCLHFDNFTPKN